jgi:hypothetical protein
MIDFTWTIRGAPALILAGLVATATADSALAWGSGGGGSGGPVKKDPIKETKLDPEKLRKLKDLTKRLRAELHLDNQKNQQVREKELGQMKEIEQILQQPDFADSRDPAVTEGHVAESEWSSATGGNIKY